MAADKSIYIFWQNDDMSNVSYFEQFNVLVDSTESYGCSVSHSKGLGNVEIATMGTDHMHATDDQKHKAMELAHKA